LVTEIVPSAVIWVTGGMTLPVTLVIVPLAG
jgi:hypothetical protein